MRKHSQGSHLPHSLPSAMDYWACSWDILQIRLLHSLILEGSFVPPENTSDATILVLEEISRIAGLIQHGAVDLTLSGEEYSDYWRAVNERTSSSRSKVHFGHYKVIAKSKPFSTFYAKNDVHWPFWLGTRSLGNWTNLPA